MKWKKQRLCPAPPFSGSCPSADCLDWPASSCNHKQQTRDLTRIERVRLLRATLILSAVLLPALPGCRQEDEIKQEIVTYEDREPINLRVAIVRAADFVWFFRLDGPESQVKEHFEAFGAFVRSVRFTEKEDAPITWTEPKEWKKDLPHKDRYASFRIAAKPKELEVKVTRLPANLYKVMDNMHRWQKQVNLPLSEEAADNEKYLTREKVANHEVTWVNMTGLGVHTLSKGADPMADGEKDFLPRIQMNQAGRIPFKFTVPEGWVKKKPREFVLEVYEIADGANKAEVTLSTAGGNLPANINRWCEQVGLRKMNGEEMVKAGIRLEVAGIDSFYVDLANPEGPPLKNRTLGVIVPLKRSSYFFVKMSGPHDLVGQHKNEFETFVKSFKKLNYPKDK